MTGLNGDRGEVRVVIAAGAARLLLAVLLLAAVTGLVSQQASACSAQPSPSGQATTIPARYLALYRQAGRAYGIPWNVLAAIGEVESDHGRSSAPGVHSGANSAGAAGPMQFGIGGAAGNTWGGAPSTPHPSAPAGTASTATTTASWTSTTPATPSPQPPATCKPTALPATCPARSSPTTTPPRTSPTCSAGPPGTPAAAPRPSPPLPAPPAPQAQPGRFRQGWRAR